MKFLFFKYIGTDLFYIFFNFLQNFFMKKLVNRAFTLIELLVVITIVGIVVLASSRINFNQISDSQKAKIFTNKIVSNIETVRNNSLIWRWVWIKLEQAQNWKVEMLVWDSWNLSTFYSTWVYIKENNLSFDFENFAKIESINCLKLDNSVVENINSWSWKIIFTWGSFAFSWGTNCSNSKKIKLNLRFKEDIQTIEINSVNWLITKSF